MFEMKLFSIFDKKAGSFKPIVSYLTNGEALREFIDLLNAKDGNPFARHPEDYDLYEVGKIELSNGKVSGVGSPIWLIAGSDCVSRPAAPQPADEVGRGSSEVQADAALPD